MSDEPKRPEWQRWLSRWSLFGIPGLLLYVLSYGPAWWFCHQIDPDEMGWPTWLAHEIYGPLESAAEATGTYLLLMDYLNLFVRVW